MPSTIVTFLSDFGAQDWFVGVVHGIVHELAPSAAVVDLNHLIPPANVVRGAFILEAAAPDFPPGSVHLAVVDPGVGTERRALAVRARGAFFVGPDNGLLEWALAARDAEVHALAEERWFRRPVSRTFHGRDVFAPVAAHLARGEPIESFGPRITDPVRLAAAPPRREGDALVGRVVFIDRFGNALTNLTAELLDGAFAGPRDGLRVGLLGREVNGLARSYGDAPVGTLVAVLGSSGRLEIAQVGGDAAVRLGIGEGDPVTVRPIAG
ncbi:MAG TPA: SAM-dependent chlorinase/fluorinase [Candidatus Acidoferrales bacterium]|nr:SAM-dependent chlorinase/fluorinase [Candidatus Acidoferrales bacterium]